MKIGVCIPCHYGYIGYLDCVLASITRQTIVPDIVSISISEYPEERPTPIYNSDLFKIIITTTSEEKNAAENRNIAAKKIIEEVDILSFFDADDYCAPRRNEIIKGIFESHDVDIVLHGYFEWTVELQKKHVNEIISELNSNNPKQIILTNNFNYRINPLLNFGQIFTNFQFHNGHSTIRVYAFKKQQYDDDERLFGCGEDSHFNYLHYKLGSKILATPLKLSLYAIDPNKLNKLDPEVEKVMLNYLNNRSLSNNVTS
jgi:hypothetical protein